MRTAGRSLLTPRLAIRLQSRRIATNPPPGPIPPKQPFRTRQPLLFTLLFVPTALVSSVVVIGLGFLAFDASTYKDRKIRSGIPVDPLVLNPERGGPRGLKIAQRLVDDSDDAFVRDLGAVPIEKEKQKLVIIGGGWAVSHSLDRTVLSEDSSGESGSLRSTLVLKLKTENGFWRYSRGYERITDSCIDAIVGRDRQASQS